MRFYKITYIVEDEFDERLSKLAGRYAKVKGWSEEELLQYAVTAASKDDIEEKLRFLEKQIVLLEEKQRQAESEHLEVHISDEERKKCKKVVDAFADEFDDLEIMVLDAGKYGFAKLTCYDYPYGFVNTKAFTNSFDLFKDLWNEWFEEQLYKNIESSRILEMDYEDMFQSLSQDTQEKIMAKKEYFARRAQIWIS